MVDYLTHFYMNSGPPFRSLSELPEEEALRVMRSLADDSLFGERFQDPLWYWRARRETEQWVREQFIAKGGKPRELNPIYMALGHSPWLAKAGPAPLFAAELHFPLAIFDEGDVSFTYPDSMVSLWFERERPEGLYNPEMNGKVFSRTEILRIVTERGLPEDCWEPRLPPRIAPYIEAQVWNREPLKKFVHE